MYDVDAVQSGLGLLFAGVGLTAGGTVALIATVAAAVNGVFLLIALAARVVLAIMHRRQGKTTTEQFVQELLDISTEAQEKSEVLKNELSQRNQFPDGK